MKYSKSIVVEIKTINITDMINMCLRRDVFIKNVINKKNDVTQFEVEAIQFTTLKKVLKKLNIDYKIKRTKGFEKVINYFKTHLVITALILLFFYLVYYYSSHIWIIQINCDDFNIPTINGNIENENNKENENNNHNEMKEENIISKSLKENIKSLLYDNNIYQGMPKKKVNTEEIKTLLFENDSKLKFVSIDVKSTSIIISLIYSNKNPMNDEDKIRESNDIVSNKNAIVKNIVVRNGTSKVIKEQIVRVDDVLIEGKVNKISNDGQSNEQSVIANGRVLGKTYYNVNASCKTEKRVKQYTNKKQLKIYINDFMLKLPFFFSKDYEYYDLKEYSFKLFGIRLKFQLLTEYTYLYKQMTTDEIKENIQKNVREKISSMDTKIYDIYSFTYDYFQLDDKMYLKGKLSLLEDIGKIR